VVDDAAEITVLQLPKFKAEATELIGTEGLEGSRAIGPFIPIVEL